MTTAPPPLPCARKARHATRANAGHALRALRARGGGHNLHVDRCLHCGDYHLFKNQEPTP